MTEQAAADMSADRNSVVAQIEGQRKVEQNMIVVACVERDAVECAGRKNAAQYVECAVTVERRDLDRNDIVDLGKSAPEICAQDHAANRGLQIEADQWDLARHRPAMGDDFLLGGRLHRR